MAQHIAVIDYQPAWPRQFADEAARIRRILGDNCVTIHHIGSTAVPGLAAKPVIDLLPVVRELAAVDHSAAAFARIGYEYLGEFGLPGRRYLRKGGDRRTHQIHIFALGSAEIDRHLAFRDYLRTHPAVCERYARLKRSLAAQYPHDIEGYCDGKDAFIKRVERAALAWQRTQR